MSTPKDHMLNLSMAEKEVLALKATWGAIGEMVNNLIMTIHYRDPESSIIFNTTSDKKYFSIILLDFLNSKVFGIEKNCIDALIDMIETPVFNSNIEGLETSIKSFKDWLDEDVQLEHDGETRYFWFPSIDKNITLKIKRIEFIRICGNISKHNILGLNRQAKIMLDIFERNEIAIDITQALLIMDEFYEQFYDDLFTYHSSTIAEFLNNMRWEIYNYLKPLFAKSIEYYWDERHKRNTYRYIFPENINNSYAKEIFWSLMNDVRSEPYIPRFKVTRHLKTRY